MGVTLLNTQNQQVSAKWAGIMDGKKCKLFFAVGGNEAGQMEIVTNSIEPGLILNLLKQMLYEMEQGKMVRVI